jgi:hypothetical protein
VQNEQAYLINIIQPLVDAIEHHKTFTAITSIERLRRFAEIHVFVVWDFMCLLKTLQRKLTCNQLLWLPPADPLGCHLVNTLLAEEESDLTADNRYLSHFALYLEAMEQCGANTENISAFIRGIEQGLSLPQLFNKNLLPNPVKRFIEDTFDVIPKERHAIAAAFAYGREHITGAMFSQILRNLASSGAGSNDSLKGFIYYFQRHIDLDGGKHSAQSKMLVANLCGTDEKKWEDVVDTAVFSLKSRLQLLDAIYLYMTYPMHTSL